MLSLLASFGVSEPDAAWRPGTILALTLKMNALFSPSKQDMRIYRNLFDHAVEGIFITSIEGRYLLVNSRLAEIYGFDSTEELMHHFEDIGSQLYVEPGRRQEFVAAMQKHGQVLQFESQVRRKDGRIIWISENARWMQD